MIVANKRPTHTHSHADNMNHKHPLKGPTTQTNTSSHRAPGRKWVGAPTNTRRRPPPRAPSRRQVSPLIRTSFHHLWAWLAVMICIQVGGALAAAGRRDGEPWPTRDYLADGLQSFTQSGRRLEAAARPAGAYYDTAARLGYVRLLEPTFGEQQQETPEDLSKERQTFSSRQQGLMMAPSSPVDQMEVDREQPEMESPREPARRSLGDPGSGLLLLQRRHLGGAQPTSSGEDEEIRRLLGQLADEPLIDDRRLEISVSEPSITDQAPILLVKLPQASRPPSSSSDRLGGGAGVGGPNFRRSPSPRPHRSNQQAAAADAQVSRPGQLVSVDISAPEVGEIADANNNNNNNNNTNNNNLATSSPFECNKRVFTFRATKTDQLGNTCSGLVTVSICVGGCDTGEIADWLFPHKRPIHTVCMHGQRVRRRQVLGDCSAPEVPEELRDYSYVDAATCSCQKCNPADTTCLGTLTRPSGFLEGAWPAAGAAKGSGS